MDEKSSRGHAEQEQTAHRARAQQEQSKSRARPTREKTTRGRGSSQRRTTAPRAGGELAADTTTQQSTPQAHPEWRHGGCQPPSPARAEGGGGTRGATRRGTPRTGGGPADPKGGGGPPPPARGAADAGQRGARHQPRAWQRARGAGGHPPLKGAENPAIYTSVKVFYPLAVAIPLPYYLTAGELYRRQYRVYIGKGRVHGYFTNCKARDIYKCKGKRPAARARAPTPEQPALAAPAPARNARAQRAIGAKGGLGGPFGGRGRAGCWALAFTF